MKRRPLELLEYVPLTMVIHWHRLLLLATIASGFPIGSQHESWAEQPMPGTSKAVEVQITDRPVGHMLTNTNVWSPDGRWIVYDTRSDPAGEKFDGNTIEIVDTHTRRSPRSVSRPERRPLRRGHVQPQG